MTTIIGSLPVTLTNGTTADATQVMSNFSFIVSQANANAAAAGANSDITSINALTTPLSKSQGGTGTSSPITVMPWAVNSGTVSALSATYSPTIALGSAVDGTVLGLRSTGVNTTTAPTFQPGAGNSAYIVTARGGGALALGDTGPANYEMLLRYRHGSLRWELMNPAMVGWNYLGVATASNAAALQVLSLIDLSTYDRIMLDVQVLPATDSTELRFQYSQNNGVGFIGTNYRSQNIICAANSVAGIGSGITTYMQIFNALGNDGNAPFNTMIELKRLGTTYTDATWGPWSAKATGSIAYTGSGGGYYTGDTSIINAVQLFMDSGSISGTVKVYGLRKS